METSRTPSASECVTVPRRSLTMGCSAAVSVENYTQLLLVQGGWSSGTLLVSPAIQTAKPGRSSLMLEVISHDFGGGGTVWREHKGILGAGDDSVKPQGVYMGVFSLGQFA